ncbi:hypothetical protein B9Z65_5102 [Elsinoe australis]|uniref:BTB domain-containing protein n=1 Tax=Elsinoe australis TaxID=40998 RepID=A0A2P7ZD38_9PEZI|nr:hypothetical protein B9Z65_5102 [Elsinoe australis]
MAEEGTVTVDENQAATEPVIETLSLFVSGDVYLKPGESAAKEFLVSSVILSNASSVFKAMFSGRFAEGQDLSTVSPPKIVLKDDDPRALEILLRLLHFKIFPGGRFMEIEESYEFAVLCNKYDCIQAMAAVTEMWLSSVLPTSAASFENLCHLFFLAVTFEFEDQRQKLIRLFVTMSTESARERFEATDTFISAAILTDIQTYREDQRQMLRKALRDVVMGPQRCSCHYIIDAKDVVALWMKIEEGPTYYAVTAVRAFINRLEAGAKLECGKPNHSPKDRCLW